LLLSFLPVPQHPSTTDDHAHFHLKVQTLTREFLGLGRPVRSSLEGLFFFALRFPLASTSSRRSLGLSGFLSIFHSTPFFGKFFFF